MTIHNISRTAAVRMFKAAKTYRLVSRTRADGKGTPDIDSTIRTIERVTSTGVYVSGGPSYAMTHLDDRDVTFHTDEAGNLLLIARTAEGAEFMRLTYELDPSEPDAAGAAPADAQSVDVSTVVAAVDRLAEVAAQMYDAEALGGLTCQEVEAVADVLRSAGHAQPAATLIEAHAHGDDDEEDRHHGQFLRIKAEHAAIDARVSAERAAAAQVR